MTTRINKKQTQPRDKKGRYGRKERIPFYKGAVALIACLTISPFFASSMPAATSAEAIQAAKVAHVATINPHREVAHRVAPDTHRLVDNQRQIKVCPEGFRLVLIPSTPERLQCIQYK